MRAVLTYHSIDRSGSAISVSPEAFDRHMWWLASSGIGVTTIDGLMALPDDSNAVAITFDDGFRSFAEVAWPRLRAHGWSATLFVVTGHVGGVNNWRGRPQPGIPTLPLLGWEQLGRLAEEGVQLGAHTISHPDLTGLDSARVTAEIDPCAAEILQYTGVTPQVFAYPYGKASSAVAEVLSSRFRWALTTELRWLGRAESAMRLPRLDMFYFRRPDRIEAWNSRRFRLYVRRRAIARSVGAFLRGT